MSKAVLLSIHPKWAEKIYSGEKAVEWRKTFPTEAEPGTPVLLYETAPVCMVTGLFFWIGKETLIIREPDFEEQEIHQEDQRLIDAGCVPLEDLKKVSRSKRATVCLECSLQDEIPGASPTFGLWALKGSPELAIYHNKGDSKMKCDELKPLVFSLKDFAYIDESAVEKNFENPHDHAVYKATEVDAAIAELKNKIEDVQATHYTENVDAGMRERRLNRALWLMTADWAEGMGLASCNIAIKLSFKERFFYHDEANREKDIKKYKHRQVVFYKYADYCKNKAEEYK